MLRSAASKVMWVGRATVFLVGLSVILALVLGVTTVALGANGGNFILGQNNTASLLTKLTGQVPGGAALQLVNTRPEAGSKALQLSVAEGKPPIQVNASAGKATNLNADKVDGKDSSQIGVNGLERVTSTTDSNSNSPKTAIAECPEGKVVVGTGGDLFGAESGAFPNLQTDTVIDAINPSSTEVRVAAFEEQSTSANWSVTAEAICATAP